MLYVYQRLISIHPFYIILDNLQISGDNLHKEDHPLNIERGDVCVYYKISLPLKVKIKNNSLPTGMN